MRIHFITASLFMKQLVVWSLWIVDDLVSGRWII